MTSPTALLRAARPRQWVKNVLVFAAPGSAAILDQGPVLVRTLAAFALLCLAASGTYLLNDAADVESDRRHPEKRRRPIAAGEVSVRTAQVAGVVCVVTAIAASFAVNLWFAAVLISYLVTTTAYSYALKHVAVVDIVTVASGFVLRALAGAAAAEVAISDWFFVVTSMGSLFMVTGKRMAELTQLGSSTESVRAVNQIYTDGFLRYVRSVSSAAAVVAYSLWAFERSAELGNVLPLFQISIVPFTTGFLRYALLVEQGHGGAPEDVVLRDRALQVIGAVWFVTFSAGLLEITP